MQQLYLPFGGQSPSRRVIDFSKVPDPMPWKSPGATKSGRVAHSRRPDVRSTDVLHVTMRLLPGLFGLRSERFSAAVIDCLRAGKELGGFRLLHFGIMDNHLHLLCEADDRESLTLGIQGLKIRLARRLNREWRASGRVWQDRYHVTVIRGRTKIERVLHYVFENYRRHRNADWRNTLDTCDWGDSTMPDPLTSVRYLPADVAVTGVTRPEPEANIDDWPVVPPRTSELAGTYSLRVKLGSYDTPAIRRARAAAPIPA